METTFDFETVSSWTLLKHLREASENRWIKYDYQTPMLKAMIGELKKRTTACVELCCQTCTETNAVLNLINCKLA